MGKNEEWCKKGLSLLGGTCNKKMTEFVHVSIGELWDKYSILLIKQNKIVDEDKLNIVATEIEYLDKAMNKYSYIEHPLFVRLKSINGQLWDIEDNIRMKESRKEFDHIFIELARCVYFTNDERAKCKKEINTAFGSLIHEVKDYIKYDGV